MSVDLNGVVAFLPGSQIDTRQIIKDTKELLNKPLDLMILKMDKFRGNIVVSRKAISEVELKEQRKELLSSINEGSVIEGKVKNLTDYGAFIDLGGLDGLVHITDISWTKINSPSDILALGQDVKVKVLKFDEELSRLSLGIKQLQENPWDSLEENITLNNTVSAKINSINDTSLNILVNDKYDGTVSINELSWLKKPPHPSKLFNVGDNVDVKITEIDEEKRKLICSIKQTKENPWTKLTDQFNVNDSFETEIVNIVDFGVFVKVHEEIDGMVHVSDLNWNEKECQNILDSFKKGDKVRLRIANGGASSYFWLQYAGGKMTVVANDGNDANRDGIELTIGADDASGTTAYIDALDGNGDQVGHISNTSGTFALTDVSDERLKKNIVDTSVKGVETIDKMKVRDFEWIKSGDKTTAGFVAQELAEAFPSAVTGEDGAMEDILDEDGNKTGERIKPMGVSRDVLVPVLIKAVQELSARISELEGK
mgnify:CR=1 FL=1